jgi:molybdopterin molybdotransferase
MPTMDAGDVMTAKLNELLGAIRTLPNEYIPTANALGRIIAEPVRARTMSPPYDIATVDGYAVRMVDVNALPANLSVQGESHSSRPFVGALDPGCAILTVAGGKMADGADALVPMADCQATGDAVTIMKQPVGCENICRAGLDFSMEEVIFEAGTVMTSRLVGLAAAMRILWLPVVRKPRVAVLAVGSDLAMPGEHCTANTVTASSLYTLPANITALCGDPVILGLAHDTVENVIEKIQLASQCDLLITIGGTSAGSGNLMANALNRISSHVETISVQLRRNDRMLLTYDKHMPICALPGNIISSCIYFSLFVRPMINHMLGLKQPAKRYAMLGRNLDAHDTSVAYLHASLSHDSQGAYHVIPVSAQDGFLLSELAKSDCLLVVNENKQLKKGDLVEFIPLAHSLVST